MIPVLLLLIGAAEPAGVVLEFSGVGKPALLRATATAADGKPREIAWAAFLDRLFEYFDRDADGQLSPAEAERVIALPLPDGNEVKRDFAKLDADANGHVTTAEFREYHRMAGFAPMVAVVREPTREQRQLSEALFRHLDRDGNGTISTVEWSRAPALMLRFDENEDERLEPAELLVGMGEVQLPGAAPWIRIAPSGAKVRVNRDFGWPRVQFGGDGEVFHTGTRPGTIECPGGRILVKADPEPAGRGFRLAKEFYLAQFTEGVGSKVSLTRAEVESDVNLQAIARMFEAADRNGDGRLTLAELRAFLDLVEEGVACQATLVIEDGGGNLFDDLDTNADGRLDTAELNAARGRAAEDREHAPRICRMTLSTESISRVFGPVAIPARKSSTKAAEGTKRQGPAWFQAMDRNGDGFVSATEFRGPPSLFTKWDRDEDGRLSLREVE